MPRCARIKPDDRGTYYHLTNRIAGLPGEWPFGDVEKQKMVSLIKRLSHFFTVDVLAFQVMGNHYHVVCYAPADVLSAAEAAERYNRYHAGAKPLLVQQDPYCLTVARQMRDISHFMSRLQQQFSSWYNRSRPRRRRGTLWAQRFRSVILQRDTALWNCLCYVEMNAVRAALVHDPADYRFGSWGEWCATGRHPFAENLLGHLVAYEGEAARARTLADIQRRFRIEFARRTAAKSGAGTQAIAAAALHAAKPPCFMLRLDRRVRYWSEGLIIGSRAFVRDTAARFCPDERARQHHLQPACGLGAGDLCAYRRLHAIPG